MSTAAVSSTRKLVSASALMAAGTMLSRVLGLVRVMLIAFILGNGTRQAGMLSLATTVPNSLYILFAGGALNTVLVPQIVRAIRNDEDGGEAYTNRIMTAFLLIVGAVAVVVTVAAPLVTMIYTSAEWRAPELAAQYSSMVMLTYLTLPQIFFYGAFFLLGQVLNARDQFGPMMWAPIANNVISILVLGLYLVVWGNGGDHSQAFTTPQTLLLGLGSTFGIVCQTLVLVPYLRKVGFRFRPRFDLRGTGLGKTFSLTKWTIGFVLVNQLALVVVTRLATTASAAGAGGLDVYNNAHLIWILPHSLITVSLTTAMLPNASRLAAAGSLDKVAEEATKTMRLALIALVPAAVGFVALAEPIVGLLFAHGRGLAGAQWVGWALMAFAVGLIPFTVQFVCLRTYYALEDTRTPFLIQVLIASSNAGLAFVLVLLVRTPGLVAAALALAYSLAYLIGVVVSWHVLTRRVPLDAGSLVMHIVRLLLGAGSGGVLAFFASRFLVGRLPGFLGNLLAVVLGLGIMGLCYLLVGRTLKVRELRDLSQLRRRASDTEPDTEPDTDEDEHASETTLPPVPPFVDETMVQTAINPRIVIAPHLPRAKRAQPVPETPPAPETQTASEPPARAVTMPSPIEPVPETSQPSAEEPEEELVASIGRQGLLIGTRFRCDQLLDSTGGVELWRAHDLVLSRDVAVHLMAPGDPRTEALLESARRGAVATDSRFLRVLDAVPVDDVDGVGAVVVSEHVNGRTLSEMLADGPLTALESAWMVRELADALSGVHAQGLFHGGINPELVVITATGAVRLAGFGIESTLRGPTQASWRELEAADVRDLAALLYATQVAKWPFGEAYGLPAAPQVGGVPVGPQVVRPGVSPALDRIVRSALTEGSGEMITTASQLAGVLETVVGSTDASAELEHRVRRARPQPRRRRPLSQAHPAPTSAPVVSDKARAASNATAAMPGAPQRTGNPVSLADPARSRPEPSFESMIPAPTQPRATTVSPAQQSLTGGSAPSAQERDDFSPRPRPRPVSTATPPTMTTPAVAGQRAGSNGASSRRGLFALLVIVLAALLVATIWWLTTSREPGRDPVQPTDPSATSTTSAQEPAGPYQIVGSTTFDPAADGGSGDENPEHAAKAYDGDPETGWPTMRYKNRANMGGQKPGVGLILDLGEPRRVSAVDLTFAQAGTTVELRVPAEGTEAPTRSEKQWKAVASQADAGTSATLEAAEPVTSQYVMLYVTVLPEVSEKRFLTQINEVVVR